jgi:hypothetical protein
MRRQIEVVMEAGSMCAMPIDTVRLDPLMEEAGLEAVRSRRNTTSNTCSVAIASSSSASPTRMVSAFISRCGHEAPWLSDRNPVTYLNHHAGKPLEAGMVISIEATLAHLAVGSSSLRTRSR